MKKDDLYELIKTLSPAEKKVFSEKHPGKDAGNFMRLFHAIANGEATNDTQVKKKFAGEKFISHLHKTKAYLYEALLHTLQPQMQQNFSRFRILQKVEFAETLLSRKLITQAEDTYLDALADAKKTQELELEHFVWAQLMGLNTHLQRSQKDFAEFAELQEKMKQHLDYSKLFFTVYESYTGRGKKGWNDLDTYLNHPLLTNPKKFLTTSAERSFEITQSLLFTVSRDYKKALASNLRVTDLVEPVADISVRSEIAYVNALFNAGLSQQSLTIDSSQTISRLEKFEPMGRLAKSHRFICLLRLKLNRYVTGKRSADGKTIAKWVESELPLFKGELNEQDLVKAHISIAGFYMKERDYSRALDYLLLINHSKSAPEGRPVIYRVAALYNLIANYELNNLDWLATTLRNYKYFQKANDSFYLIEKMTLAFLNNAIRITDKKLQKEAKQKFEAEILQAAQQEKTTGLAYLQNIDWISNTVAG